MVTAWHIPARAYGAGGAAFSPGIDPADFKDSASAALETALAALGGQANGVQIERVARRDQPALVLLEEARGADMLVVGSRGHGGFVGLLLGSVSHQCALHAACPVLIASGDLVLPGGDVPDAGGHQNGKAGPGDLVEPAGRSTRYLGSEAAEHGYQRGLAAGSDGGRAGTGKQAG